MAIGWRENMATGGRLLDEQHRRLIERADGLLAAVSLDADRRVVEAAMRDFGNYAVRHFSQDEDCALRGQCPALEWNGAARAELIRILATFREGYERPATRGQAGSRLSDELSIWVERYVPGPEGTSRPCVTTDR